MLITFHRFHQRLVRYALAVTHPPDGDNLYRLVAEAMVIAEVILVHFRKRVILWKIESILQFLGGLRLHRGESTR